VTTAGLVGTGSLAIKLAIAYANERKVFGDTPISAYQGLQFPLAQCHVEIEAARLLNYKAAANFDIGEPYGSDANAANRIEYGLKTITRPLLITISRYCASPQRLLPLVACPERPSTATAER